MMNGEVPTSELFGGSVHGNCTELLSYLVGGKLLDFLVS
jgi:hypothetical protein